METEHLRLNSFSHYFIWLATGLESLPKQVHHRVQFNASSSKFKYLLFCSRSCSSYLSLLSCLHVPSILHSMKFLCTVWLIHLAFLFFLLYKECFLPPWFCVLLHHFWHDWSNWSFLCMACPSFAGEIEDSVLIALLHCRQYDDYYYTYVFTMFQK